MKKLFLTAQVAAFFVFIVSTGQAQTDTAKTDTSGTQTDTAATTTAKPKLVGGAAMLPTATLAENISKSADHTTLVKALNAAGLVQTLSGVGPYTVFAPHNDAFVKIQAGVLDNLLKPENKVDLAALLTYHVVPGKLTTKDLAIAVSRGNGKAELTTVSGGKIYLSINAERYLELTDENGNLALVTIFDAAQANGVMHVINNVLIPKAN